MQLLLFIILGLAAGALIGWLLGKNKSHALENSYKQQLSLAGGEKATLLERANLLNGRLEQLNAELTTERDKNGNLTSSVAHLQTTNEHLSGQLIDQKNELQNLQGKFNKEFENLANRIFEEKSSKFAEQNRSNLDLILNPLKEKIHAFEKKVEDTYKSEAAERNSLKGEIKSLVDLNRQISEDANNLAKALKGDTKKQGNWGEIILEKILERSGLEKGREYETQASFTTEEGKRLQPDVIVKLPDEKYLIVDSKVSLVAYEAFVNATSEEDRSQYLNQHIASVRNHVKQLSEKNYQDKTNLKTPDFVLMFMPIESSFSTAIQADNELFSYAWEKRIVIVSPTTLLATLNTIASIWKHEKQTRNALEIAEQGAKLYDKFVSFTEELLTVGRKIEESRNHYADAMKKLSEGRGNLVGSAQKLKELGIKTSKQIPASLLERSEEEL